MNGDHSARATRALRSLGERDPALAALALWCRHRDADTGDAPARSDGATISYGPDFAELPLHEQVGLAAHHVLHVAFRHAARAATLRSRFGDGFNAPTFNLAADALVNETLLLAGFALPRPCVTLTGLLEAALDEGGAPEAALARYDAETLYVRLMRREGGTGGRAAADEDGAASATPSAADRARGYALRQRFAPDLEHGGADPDAVRRAMAEDAEWRQRVARALEAGRRAGVGIGALGARLADLPRSRTPWETVLRGLVTRAVTEAPRQSHRRPSRRWIALDAAARDAGTPAPAYEPALVRETAAPRIAVGIDASGSVDAHLLALFAAQVAGIGRRTGAEVHVLVFDEEVRAQTRMQGAAWEREITAIGFARGGGTSFVGVIAAAVRLDPAAIVILTDLDGPFGAAPGRVPVVWAVPDPGPGAAPPFGRVLSLAR